MSVLRAALAAIVFRRATIPLRKSDLEQTMAKGTVKWFNSQKATPRTPFLETLLAYPNLSVALLDRPARNRAQRWRCESLSSAQIEAGVMPRTPHRIADHKSFGKRPMIVRAMRHDREMSCPRGTNRTSSPPT